MDGESEKVLGSLRARHRPCRAISARSCLALVDGQNRASLSLRPACSSSFWSIAGAHDHFPRPATRSKRTAKTASRWVEAWIRRWIPCLR